MTDPMPTIHSILGDTNGILAAAKAQAERVREKTLTDVEALVRKRRDRTTYTSDAKLLNLVLDDIETVRGES